MKIWDKKIEEFIEEKEYGKEKLEFMYNTVLGRILLKTIFSSKWFSKINGIYQKSRFSKRKIKSFIKLYDIDMEQHKGIEKYKSFSEFFTRKRDVSKYITEESMLKENLIAVADSKLKVFNLNKNIEFKVKQSIYNLKDLIQDDELSKEFENGICLIYRLTVDDYHRYIFLDDGYLEKEYYINGKLHTVQPISDKYNVYSRNCRNVSVLNTENFGKVLQIEVGAMLVGKINNHKKIKFLKFEEKGFFDYGGSTIIQVIKKDKIIVNKEIIEMSKNGIETKVEIGMIIGKNIIV